MLKKAGIVVAASAAALLAVSPLAFAGDKGGGHDHEGNHEQSPSSAQINYADTGRDSTQSGLINVGDINALNDLNVCPGVTAAVGLGNLLGILGSGVADADATTDDITCVNDDSLNQVNNDE